MKVVFNKGSASNTWEPHPWNANWLEVRKQKSNFLKCVSENICWQKFSFKKFEGSDLWGRESVFFRDLDVEFFAETANRRYLLMENIWFGFPDPPQFRLAFSKADDFNNWFECGYFYDMPDCWTFVDCKHPIPSELKVSTKLTDD